MYIRHTWKLHKLKESHPFSTLPSSDGLDGQLTVLNRLILDCFGHHTSLKITKFTGPSFPWMKELDHNLIRKNTCKEDWTNFRNIRNKSKQKTKDAKNIIFQKVFNTKKCWRNFENSSPFAKFQRQKSRNRYKLVKKIFQWTCKTLSCNHHTAKMNLKV